MKALLLFCCLFSYSALAGWEADINLGIDGENFKKEKIVFEDSKEQVLNVGNYILKLTIKKGQEPKSIDVAYTVQEKKGKDLIMVNKGDESLDEAATAEIYAKGETNQPNSIISFKFKK